MKLSELDLEADQGGIVLGMDKRRRKIYTNTEDTHTLVLGATRAGKSRTVVLPSICTLALAGESMVVIDPKSELYCYTYPFLERLGYEVITIDFLNPDKSTRYNFLQPVIDAVNIGNNALAVTRARDIAAMLVPDESSKTEPIWVNGERAIITVGILCVVMENRGHPEYQNLSNVYHFLMAMGKPGDKDEIPLSRYLKRLSNKHPAKLAAKIAEVAPSKMRGSFFASGGTTLSLFTDPNLHTMTAATDFDLYATGERKRAIFIILPAHRKTFYSIASLFVYQHYQALADQANTHGGRLSRRVNFLCDEFGNFTKIPDFATILTSCGSAGVRWHLFLQDFAQLDDIYGKENSGTIRGNTETWIYLRSNNNDTLKTVCESLGNYTIRSQGESNSNSGESASYSLTGRDLLTVDEIKRIKRPYQLIMSSADPCMMYAPDLSKTVFNDMLGLGNKRHNSKVIELRQARRPSRAVQVAYWDLSKYLKKPNNQKQEVQNNEQK